MFGLSESYTIALFNKHIGTIASCMKHFVRWFPPESVFCKLPVSFMARYSNVYIIIDTFEIEVKAPQDAFDQSETFSAYKSCNTAKYLVGITPDGTIMYVSKGYVGRNSDKQVTVHSDFVEHLPKGKAVMADRGFKSLEPLLHAHGCKLIRPSVNKGEPLSKELSKLGQVIASLRIHVERAIGRIREFRMLNIHSAIPGSMMSFLDDAVIIACALVNCQINLVKYKFFYQVLIF